ncbi:unnamed protein product [Paramecium primaurelia]|uniref:Uncharacterized protein n=1 Tax=Paramecium primaurelia TaxID=5886 RepID=A0A8S1MWS0_PARPR|nr:unnamed protein product [Paramecium primaurelia]
MIEDDESEGFFQFKLQKKIKKHRRIPLRIQKHYESLNLMQTKATDQEQQILSLIQKRGEFYSKNKQIIQWKENISESHSAIFVNLIKSESETFEDSEYYFQQPIDDFPLGNYSH